MEECGHPVRIRAAVYWSQQEQFTKYEHVKCENLFSHTHTVNSYTWVCSDLVHSHLLTLINWYPDSHMVTIFSHLAIIYPLGNAF